MNPRDISVVIPTINEEASIGRCVHSAIQSGAADVIVSDGGSGDQTISKAKEAGASKIVHSIPGRGTQLNSGAFVADGEWLLFLHADNLLDREALQQICEHPTANWGAFRQRIDSSRSIFRALEFGNNLRVQLRRMPFGDQAIFVRRSLFKEQGGFAEIPLMEDVEFSRQMRRISKPLLLKGPVTIDPRRWESNGVYRQTLRNWRIQLAYQFGASPESLRRRYR